MVKRQWYLVIFIATLVGTLIYYYSVDTTLVSLISCALIGLWLLYTVKFIAMIKYHGEFNSSHNTVYFIGGSLFFGLIYSWWGNFTNLLSGAVFNNNGIFTNYWIVIFSLPYLFYGSVLLWRTYRKYFMVYLKSRSFEAKKFGLFLSLLLIVTDIVYLGWFYTVDGNGEWGTLEPLNPGVDFFNIMLILYASILVIRYGFFGNLSNTPVVSRRTASTRTSREPYTSTAVREQTSTAPIPSTQERSANAAPRRIQRVQREEARVTVQPAVPISNYERSTQRSSQKSASKSASSTQKMDGAQIRQYKPKGSVLSAEDFKCIFCFQLPKLPDDESRGIILCPHCKHPAHADEFKDWSRNSNLCSRCDGVIPENYRRNPEVIPTKRYLMIMKKFYSK